MSIEQDITTLEALVELDERIGKATKELETASGSIEGVRQELATLEARLEADATSVAEMEKTRNDAISELRSMSGQIDRSRERLQRARNEREQQAAERELDELRKIQRDKDGDAKRLGELADLARESIAAGEVRRTELSAQLEGSLPGATSTIASAQKELDAGGKDRTVLLAKLPSRLRRRYEQMHGRGKKPVADTATGNCNACFLQLPPMMFHKLLPRTEFGECPNCHRIIYYTAPVPKEPEPEEEAPDAPAPKAAAATKDVAGKDTATAATKDAGAKANP